MFFLQPIANLKREERVGEGSILKSEILIGDMSALNKLPEDLSISKFDFCGAIGDLIGLSVIFKTHLKNIRDVYLKK